MDYFTRLVGTLAVILVVAALIGGGNLLSHFRKDGRSWKYVVLAGLLGGIFGVYGNTSGVELNGAVISVRDIGPMLSGFIGGPLGGLLGGTIAGLHRLTMGGITAHACVVATCCLGTACGFLSDRYRKTLTRPWWAFCVGAAMELFHLGVVLIMVKPFETALDIVKQIIIPFVLINALGFTIMIAMMSYIEKQRTIAAEQIRLQSDLKTATIIQHSLLPPINKTYPGRAEIALAADMDAAKEVGGDFYDFFFVDTDHLAFLIGDVSGKSIPGALFMVRSKQTLQSCIRDLKPLSLAVSTANDNLYAGNEAEMFVTAWIGVLTLSTGELHYINAGHNPPMLLKPDGNIWLKHKSGFVLAGMEGMSYKEDTLFLKPGDRLFLYTDGVTEAEDAAHNLYGDDRLAACLAKAGEKSVEEIIESVSADLALHVKNYAQFDDITMLCLEYKGSSTP